MRKNVVLCLVSGLLGAVSAVTIYNQANRPTGWPRPSRLEWLDLGSNQPGPVANAPLPNAVRPRPPVEDDLTLEERVNVAVYENVNRSVVNVDHQDPQHRRVPDVRQFAGRSRLRLGARQARATS